MRPTEQQIKWLKDAAKESFDKIDASAYFLSLFTDNYRDDPLCALQLGYAMLKGKPLYFLARLGTEIPPAIKRLAERIEYYDSQQPDSMKEAVDRLALSIRS